MLKWKHQHLSRTVHSLLIGNIWNIHLRPSFLMTPIAVLLAVALALQLPGLAHAHGYLMVPASRASGWRLRINGIPTNYDDNGLNCGGFAHQWQDNGGKCGVCGDPWDGPRDYERPGGRMVPGVIIPSTFQEGEVIKVAVKITANHRGWHEFRICDVRQANGLEASHECLNKTLLADSTGRTRFSQGASSGDNIHQLVLPQGLTCPLCVLQWKWHCGNNVPISGPQEEFYGCSDLTINSRSQPPFTPPTQPPRPPTQATQPPTQPPRPLTQATRRPTQRTQPPRPPTQPTPRPATTPLPLTPWNDPNLPYHVRQQNYIKHVEEELLRQTWSRTHIGK